MFREIFTEVEKQVSVYLFLSNDFYPKVPHIKSWYSVWKLWISVIFKQVISKEVKQQYTVILYADNNVRVVETTIKKGSVEKAYKKINRIEIVLNQYIAKGAIRWQWESRPISNM